VLLEELACHTKSSAISVAGHAAAGRVARDPSARKSPVITDNGNTIAESGAIAE